VRKKKRRLAEEKRRGECYAQLGKGKKRGHEVVCAGGEKSEQKGKLPFLGEAEKRF